MTEITLEGAPNFRDLGGQPTENGMVVRSRLVYRSGHLAHLTDDDHKLLSGMGIRTIVDFRLPYEREMSGRDRLPRNANYVLIPIGDPTTAPHVRRAFEHGDFSTLSDLAEHNRSLIRDYAAEIGRLLVMVSKSENLPMVFHCIGGKDRTGIAAALLLSILGVSQSTVCDDYLRSNRHLHRAVAEQIEVLERVASNGTASPRTDENLIALRRFFVLEEEYIEAAWHEIDRVAGSFEVYVRQWLGLSSNVVSRLQSTLLEPAPDTAF